MDNTEETLFIISLGSNSGPSELQIRDAVSWLSDNFELVGVSEIYRTEPVGHAKGIYYNAVAAIRAILSAGELDNRLKIYEVSKGRDDGARERGDVPIDLDIVLADDKVLREWEYNQEFFRRGFRQLNTVSPYNKR